MGVTRCPVIIIYVEVARWEALKERAERQTGDVLKVMHTCGCIGAPGRVVKFPQSTCLYFAPYIDVYITMFCPGWLLLGIRLLYSTLNLVPSHIIVSGLSVLLACILCRWNSEIWVLRGLSRSWFALCYDDGFSSADDNVRSITSK